MDSEERRFKLLDTLLDYSKGTLWWVHNRLWKEQFAGFVWKKNSDFHPGLSICRRDVEGIYNTVPMLLGTSKRPHGSNALSVSHMSPEGASHHDRPGYFRVLRPCPLRLDYFGRKDTITQNVTKPRLESDEMRVLDKMLSGKEV